MARTKQAARKTILSSSSSSPKVANKTISSKPNDKPIDKEIDCFDFTTYEHEFWLCSFLYKETMLYLKTAIYVIYKYEHLKENNPKEFEKFVAEEKKNSSNTWDLRKWIDKCTEMLIHDDMLMRWWKHFAPEKYEEATKNDELIELTIDKYRGGNEYVMYNILYRKYMLNDDKALFDVHDGWWWEYWYSR